MPSMKVATTHADLLSLDLEPPEQMDVRCRTCDSAIIFEPDDVDTLQSLFVCRRGWPCDKEWTWYDLFQGKDKDSLHVLFYTTVDVETDLWVMKEEETNRCRFSKLHKASADECWEAAKEQLRVRREQIEWQFRKR